MNSMETITNLHSREGVEKLKELVGEINMCLFCTNLRTDNGSTCRPMSAQQTDEDGNIWFFSEVESDKNKEIQENKNVQLFFAHPDKSSYLVVNGHAEVIIDKTKTEELLWSPLLKTWFRKGKDDLSIAILKVNTQSAYYWDTDGNKMIDFLKYDSISSNGHNAGNGKRRLH